MRSLQGLWQLTRLCGEVPGHVLLSKLRPFLSTASLIQTERGPGPELLWHIKIKKGKSPGPCWGLQGICYFCCCLIHPGPCAQAEASQKVGRKWYPPKRLSRRPGAAWPQSSKLQSHSAGSSICSAGFTQAARFRFMWHKSECDNCQGWRWAAPVSKHGWCVSDDNNSATLSGVNSSWLLIQSMCWFWKLMLTPVLALIWFNSRTSANKMWDDWPESGARRT